jgi:hypothetical protein
VAPTIPTLILSATIVSFNCYKPGIPGNFLSWIWQISRECPTPDFDAPGDVNLVTPSF